MRRTPLAGLAAGLALALAACGGGSDGKTTAQPQNGGLTGRGPITFVTGKDLSGNLQKQIDTWNGRHPAEQARVVELPEDADSQRQQMVQNAQTKSDAYTILNTVRCRVRKLSFAVQGRTEMFCPIRTVNFNSTTCRWAIIEWWFPRRASGRWSNRLLLPLLNRRWCTFNSNLPP